MDWSYVAGYFDADGSASIAVSNRGGFFVSMDAKICFSGSIPTLEAIRRFLHEQDVKSNKPIEPIHSKLNPWGKSSHFYLRGDDAIIRFLEEVSPFIVEKNESLLILVDMILQKRSIKNNGGIIADNLKLLEPYRESIHKLAKKGPIALVPIVQREKN